MSETFMVLPPWKSLPQHCHRVVSNPETARSLNEQWFTTLLHARVVVETWRRKYIEDRALGGLTQTAYAKTLPSSDSLTPDSKVGRY